MELEKTEKIIAIGALGGSGTRAVAQILIDSGVYIGDDLNESNDNLVFSRLFKNPEWYNNACVDDVRRRMLIFAKYMRGERFSIIDFRDFVHATHTNSLIGGNVRFYSKLVRKFFPNKNRTQTKIWGWKEPNSQIFVNHIKNFFPEIKYIHVLRNGLDMAFSKNLQQLVNWGYIYNIYINGSETESELAVKQLEFWIKSSEDIIRKGKKLFKKNFYLLNHTSFCKHAVTEVEKLLDFLGLDVSKSAKEKLYQIPIVPPSFHRYKKYDLSIFSEDQIRSVRKLGFDI